MEKTGNSLKVAQHFCQALTARNLDKLLGLFADKVDWYIPGNEKVAPWTGRRFHKKEIQAFFLLLWKHTEPITARIDHMLAADDFAVITGEFSTRMLPTRKIVDSIFSIHLTIKDDVIIRYRLQEDSFAVADALQ